jgi:thiol-disulfide isomerase/thioredoxin/tetratricopeptide (TPR) repeat protein
MITHLAGLSWVAALWWAWVAAVAEPSPTPARVVECLDLQDIACAEEAAAALGLDTSTDPSSRAMAGRVAFSAGRYVDAAARMREAVELGYVDDAELLPLLERTVLALSGWVEVEAQDFRVRFRPGVDVILVDEVLDVLRRTDRFVTPLLGAKPPGRTIVELYPDGRSFIAASSLTKDDVEATGVVALAKWSRLLVTSPRVLGRGYDWKTTVSHEYIHLVVAHNTADEAPVWIQEAIARFLDTRWRSGQDAYTLGGQSGVWLAEALHKGDLVPFAEMHPSLAKIKVLDDRGEIDEVASARRASVAYAQLSSLMDYCFTQAGEGVLRVALPAIRRGDDAMEALARATGTASFEQLVAAWEAWVRQQPDMAGKLANAGDGQGIADALAPTILDGGSDEELDPVMSRRRDLANFMRLGELLHRAGRYRAALVEYEKATVPEEGRSPLLANRKAASLVEIGDFAKARQVMAPALEDFPEFAMSWQTMGWIATRERKTGEAIDHLRRALDYNPFHLATREAFLALLRENGVAEEVTREVKVLGILRRGGDDVARAPLHVRDGELILPRSPEALRAAASKVGDGGLLGQPAPEFEVTSLSGPNVRLSTLRGKVVLVDFWATWCGPCRAVMPTLSDLSVRYADQGLVVVGISDEVEGVVTKFVEGERRRGREFRQTLALEKGGVRSAYGVRSLPTLVIIDRRGVVRELHVGAGDMAAVEALVQQLLAEAG